MQKQIRRGAGIEEASGILRVLPSHCALGLAFFRATDLLKLDAMVEDWSPDRIVWELGESNQAQARPAIKC